METGGRNLNEILVIPDANKTLSDIRNLTKHQTMGVAIMQKYIIVKEQFGNRYEGNALNTHTQIDQWLLTYYLSIPKLQRLHRWSSGMDK